MPRRACLRIWSPRPFAVRLLRPSFSGTPSPAWPIVWSNALAAEGRTSPEEDIEAIKRVTLAGVNRVAKLYLADQNSITAILKPVPTGEPVAGKGYGGAEEVTSAPTKPVELPAWAASALAQFKVPANFIEVSDTKLPNGIRLIVKTDRTSPTVSVAGAVKHDSDLETPPGQEGVSDILDGLFSYGTQTLDRLAFQKALDDIAANESAGFHFSLDVLKEHFSRGVELLADNELHPALPAQAFSVVQQQTAQFVAGQLRSPGYRTSRALDVALLPAGDPVLREVTPATVGKITLDDVKKFYAAAFRPDLTTIVVIGDVTPEEAKSVIGKWFGDWKAAGPKPNVELPPVPLNKPSAANVADRQAVQDSVTLSEQLNLNRFDPDYYPLQLGNHVLGGGFYATRFILAYIALGLQAGLARAIEWRTASPDFVLIAAVFIALSAPRDTAMLACFILGALHDLTGQGTLGLMAFSYGVAAVFIVSIQQAVNRRHPLTHFLLTGIAGTITAIIVSLHGWIRPPAPGVHPPVLPLFYSAVYSAILAPVLLGILQRMNRVFRFQRKQHL